MSAEKDAHDAKCEREYTPNGYIFIDCLCHMRRAMAAAWDKGWDQGTGDAWQNGGHQSKPNPYRVFSSDDGSDYA